MNATVKSSQDAKELAALRAFAKDVAALKADGDIGDDGEEFILENDAAVSALGEIIVEARALTQGAGAANAPERLKGLADLSVGDPVWLLDRNKRVYNGRQLVWREQWRELRIVSETSRSFSIGGFHTEIKIPKNGTPPKLPTACGALVYSQAEIDRYEWMRVHARRVADAVHYLGLAGDADLIMRVAEIVGYKPTTEPAGAAPIA